MRVLYNLLLIISANALPLKPHSNMGHLPRDTIHNIMEYLNFKDSLALSSTQKWNQITNPLKRMNTNPLMHHAAQDDQIFLLLSVEKFQRQVDTIKEILGFLLKNPSINISKMIDYIIRSNLGKHFSYILEEYPDFCMFTCAKLGNINLLKYLIINFNVDPGLRGNLALLLACQEGRLEVVEYLLSFIDLGVGDNLCLVLASDRGHEAVVERLLQDPRIDPTYNDYAAAVQAYRRKFDRILDMLLRDDRVDPEELTLSLYDSELFNLELANCIGLLVLLILFSTFKINIDFLP